MNAAALRVYAAQIIFLCALIAACWALLLRPMKERLVVLRAEFETQTAQIAEFERAEAARPESGSQALERIAAEHDAMVERLNVSSSTSLIYDALRDLAREHGVEIERIEPARTMGTRGQAAAAQISASGHSIKFSGTYPDVAEFIQTVQEQVGITKVTSLRLLPSTEPSDPPRVDARIDATHYGLIERASAKGLP